MKNYTRLAFQIQNTFDGVSLLYTSRGVSMLEDVELYRLLTWLEDLPFGEIVSSGQIENRLADGRYHLETKVIIAHLTKLGVVGEVEPGVGFSTVLVCVDSPATELLVEQLSRIIPCPVQKYQPAERVADDCLVVCYQENYSVTTVRALIAEARAASNAAVSHAYRCFDHVVVDPIFKPKVCHPCHFCVRETVRMRMPDIQIDNFMEIENAASGLVLSGGNENRASFFEECFAIGIITTKLRKIFDAGPVFTRDFASYSVVHTFDLTMRKGMPAFIGACDCRLG